MSKRIPQPGLFDEPEPEPQPKPSRAKAVTAEGWQEVPQPVFLSWSEARQLDYCARRDFDSAVEAEEAGDEAMAEWYQERGTAYLIDRERVKLTGRSDAPEV